MSIWCHSMILPLICLGLLKSILPVNVSLSVYAYSLYLIIFLYVSQYLRLWVRFSLFNSPSFLRCLSQSPCLFVCLHIGTYFIYFFICRSLLFILSLYFSSSWTCPGTNTLLYLSLSVLHFPLCPLIHYITLIISRSNN